PVSRRPRRWRPIPTTRPTAASSTRSSPRAATYGRCGPSPSTRAKARDTPTRRCCRRSVLQQARIRRGRLQPLVVEALARVAPEQPREDHTPKAAPRREAWLLVLLVEQRRHVEDDVEPDEVRERERPHRMVRAVHHRRVDVGDRTDAALEAADRVDD